MPFNTEQITLKNMTLELINQACHYNISALETLYHPLLVIVIINEEGKVTRLNYQQNLELFKQLGAQGAQPLTTDAEFNYIEVNGSEAQVVVTRKIAITGKPEKIIFSLYWKHDGTRWQVYREMAFAQADVHPTTLSH